MLYCLKQSLPFNFCYKGVLFSKSFVKHILVYFLIWWSCVHKNHSLKKLRNIFLIFKYFCRICEAAKVHGLLEQELAHAVNACSHALNKANPRFPEVKKNRVFYKQAITSGCINLWHGDCSLSPFENKLDEKAEDAVSAFSSVLPTWYCAGISSERVEACQRLNQIC